MTKEINSIEDELEQAKAYAEKCENELKEFAYMVSHDLKAPLRAINQLAGWLAKDHGESLSEEGKELIDLLMGRLDRMNNLMEGILQYSRIGRIREPEREVDINGMIRNVLATINPPENIRINSENLPSVVFEPMRIEQVFRQLIENAVRYNDKPEGLVNISADEEGDFVRFTVSDNGPGIPEKDHDKIFLIFQTLSPKDEVDSVGVGLTLVKKIIELKGGRVWVESKPGQGANFHFTVPKKH